MTVELTGSILRVNDQECLQEWIDSQTERGFMVWEDVLLAPWGFEVRDDGIWFGSEAFEAAKDHARDLGIN